MYNLHTEFVTGKRIFKINSRTQLLKKTLLSNLLTEHEHSEARYQHSIMFTNNHSMYYRK